MMVKEALEKNLFKGVAWGRVKWLFRIYNMQMIQYSLENGGVNNMSNLMCILTCFEEASGLKVNLF